MSGRSRTRPGLLTAALLAAGLTACGGDDGGTAPRSEAAAATTVASAAVTTVGAASAAPAVPATTASAAGGSASTTAAATPAGPGITDLDVCTLLTDEEIATVTGGATVKSTDPGTMVDLGEVEQRQAACEWVREIGLGSSATVDLSLIEYEPALAKAFPVTAGQLAEGNVSYDDPQPVDGLGAAAFSAVYDNPMAQIIEVVVVVGEQVEREFSLELSGVGFGSATAGVADDRPDVLGLREQLVALARIVESRL